MAWYGVFFSWESLRERARSGFGLGLGSFSFACMWWSTLKTRSLKVCPKTPCIWCRASLTVLAKEVPFLDSTFWLTFWGGGFTRIFSSRKKDSSICWLETSITSPVLSSYLQETLGSESNKPDILNSLLLKALLCANPCAFFSPLFIAVAASVEACKIRGSMDPIIAAAASVETCLIRGVMSIAPRCSRSVGGVFKVVVVFMRRKLAAARASPR
mmetsp:Transcript_33595/g.81387  ORF Transcript_33595/g.81387 Transcript_33595/m.81387 type:complete len:214 (-) Transcript_33595:2390-3031(-)